MAAYANIRGVEFGIQTDEQRRVQSRTAVQTADLFLGQNPVPGGLYDARMGTTDMRYTCTTCGHDRQQCPGHPGHIQLAVPIVLPLSVGEIRRWLRVICLHCGSLMFDSALNSRVRNAPPSKRLAIAAAAVKTDGVACPNCGKVHWKVVKTEQDHFTIVLEPPAGKKAEVKSVTIYPYQLARVFQRVSNEVVVAMGRNPEKSHPRFLVIDVLQAPPVSIRPAIRKAGPGGHSASHNDLNSMLQYIVKANSNVFSGSGAMALPKDGQPIPEKLAENMQMLQLLVYDLLQGSGVSATQRSGRRGTVIGSRATKSIAQRFPRKAGRFRKNLAGGRTFAIARNTISGDSKLGPDEIGIPESFARSLQVVVTVQPETLAENMRYFLNGRRQYPGATRVWKASTRTMHDVDGLRGGFQLEAGDVLYRDVINGDVACFNRQPSLERSAINAHRVVVIREIHGKSEYTTPPKKKTFRFTVLSTPLYNADFDGDEMNLWMMAHPGPRAEALVLGQVTQAFISTKNSKPVIGQVQDSTVGSFLLSRIPEMDKVSAMTMFENCSDVVTAPDFADMEPNDTITGREAISRLLRQFPISLKQRPAWFSEAAEPYVEYSPDETLTVIKAGTLKTGVLDKATVGSGASVFHQISRKYGPKSALDVIFALQQMTISYMDMRGFTLSIGDMIVPDDQVRQVHEIVAEMLQEAELINDRLMRGEIIPPLGLTTHEYYERLQIEALKVPDTALGPAISRIDIDTNGLFQMVATGSKGNFKNMFNISSVCGQVTINGQRVSTNTGRTLAYFPLGDMDPRASGFITNNYICGLKASEHYFGSMNGRDDLTKKALSTASTGYANRKSVMSTQSAVVDSTRMVCGPNLIQNLYGEDGMDTRQVELIRYKPANFSNAKMREVFGVEGLEGAAWHQEELAQLFRDRDSYRKIILTVEQVNFSFSLQGKILMAVDVASIVEAIVSDSAEAAASDSLESMHKAVSEFCQELPYLLLNNTQRIAQAPVPEHMKAAVVHLQRQIRVELSSAMLKKMGMGPDLLQLTFDEIRLRYVRSLIAPGEAVGVQAAQAVSEPYTQYMLDSHHRSVSGGTSKAGIVRPQEIMGARPVDKERSSEMLLRGLVPSKIGGEPVITNDRALLQELADSIKMLNLRQLIGKWEILYEPFPTEAELRRNESSGERAGEEAYYPEYAPGGESNDWPWMIEYIESSPLLSLMKSRDNRGGIADLTQWCARFELQRIQLVMKGIALETIVTRLRVAFPTSFILHTTEGSSDNAEQIVIRVYLTAASWRRGTSSKSVSEEKLATDFYEEMLNYPIRGIEGISDARVERIIRHRVEPEMIPSESGKSVPNPDAGKLVVEANAFGIRTTGTNINGALLHSRIDKKSIVSSSIGDTIKMFGIEAGRAKIISEIRRSLGGKTPNIRHAQLYADIMTRTGRHTPFEITGITQREESNVLLRATAHGPIPILTAAALDGTYNMNEGMATPQVLGGVPLLGSASCKLVIDETFVAANCRSVGQIVEAL